VGRAQLPYRTSARGRGGGGGVFCRNLNSGQAPLPRAKEPLFLRWKKNNVSWEGRKGGKKRPPLPSNADCKREKTPPLQMAGEEGKRASPVAATCWGNSDERGSCRATSRRGRGKNPRTWKRTGWGGTEFLKPGGGIPQGPQKKR